MKTWIERADFCLPEQAFLRGSRVKETRQVCCSIQPDVLASCTLVLWNWEMHFLPP